MCDTLICYWYIVDNVMISWFNEYFSYCRYIEEKKKDHWYLAPSFIFKDVEELNRLRIAIWLTHKMNHQDMGERWMRRAHLVEELVRIFRELDLQYRLFPLDINVRAMPHVNSDGLSSNWHIWSHLKEEGMGSISILKSCR